MSLPLSGHLSFEAISTVSTSTPGCLDSIPAEVYKDLRPEVGREFGNAFDFGRPQALSTYLDSPALQTNEVSPGALSLTALVKLLASQTSAPSLEQIYDWLENAEVSAEELAPYRGFKDGNYWRHLVCRNEFVEMLVLCWRPGQRTPIHDHNGSHGGVRVCEGTMWETTFTYDPAKGLRYKTASEYSTGAVTGSDIPDIHQLGNPDVSEQDMVTIHIYAPPLGVLHTYKPGSAAVDLYTPPEPE